MPNNKWDEENIENLLKDFPTIKDERSKEEIYGRLQKAHKPQTKSRNWIPYFVAALAFITFGVLLASMLSQNSNDSAFDVSDSESGEDRAAESSDSSSEALENGDVSESEQDEHASSNATDAEEGSESFNSMESTSENPASTLYNDQLGEMALFTVGLTENAVVIPVSFVVWNSKLQNDFGTAEVGAVELYNRYAAEIDEEALGFDDYHPYSGRIEKTETGIEHLLPIDHNYDMSSASINVYFNSLLASFNESKEISIVDDNGNPAVFDQVGSIEPLETLLGNIAYYSYVTANGFSYLVPGYDMPFENAVLALEAMKSSPNDLYVSLVPDGLEYSVSETEKTVTLAFDEAVNFDSLGYQEATRMIEGMVLTADSFGKELVLDNTDSKTWNRFDFTGPLPVPAGINVKDF